VYVTIVLLADLPVAVEKLDIVPGRERRGERRGERHGKRARERRGERHGERERASVCVRDRDGERALESPLETHVCTQCSRGLRGLLLNGSVGPDYFHTPRGETTKDTSQNTIRTVQDATSTGRYRTLLVRDATHTGQLP
jgi:hypothetical protein